MADSHAAKRLGYASCVPPAVVADWPAAKAHIQRVECVAVIIVMVLMAPLISHRNVLWFCDNSSVLGALVKGRSNDPVVHVLGQLMALFLFRINAIVWWEFVESEANWSDGVSRKGSGCAWAKRHNFTVQDVVMPALAAGTVAEAIVQLRSLSGIGVFALAAFDDILQALGVSAASGG